MPATLTWIDHDSEARDRMQRVLALFEERDTRDELGLGAIRDSFSDILFPGTSTIQTRLRYFLIVPWVYMRMEKDGVPAHRVVQVAREMELDITAALLDAGETGGVFGSTAGRRLKNLPSLIYWAGLAHWGIRRFNGTRSRYHQALDIIRERRLDLARTDEGDRIDPSLITWDPSLPEPPRELPDLRTLELTTAEAEYLQDKVARSCEGTLLAHLFLNPSEVTGSFPWEHPAAPSFPEPIRHILYHARLFSTAMHGASLLYNLLLSRAADRDERVTEYEEKLELWRSETDFDELARWDLGGLWAITFESNHRIAPLARRFVEEWVERAVELGGDVKDDPASGRRIRTRERGMKGALSRFENARMREQWGGASSPDAFTYRWSDVSVLGNDLYRGFTA